jgi:hypothetical protein
MASSMIRGAFAALLSAALSVLAPSGLKADAPAPSRPTLTSLTLTLEDGRTYSLSPAELADPQGGAVFWGDWAVANLLVPSHTLRSAGGTGPLPLWTGHGPSGQLPAFLVNTAQGPVYPLDPGGPQAAAPGGEARPGIAAITVGYADGRRLSLNRKALRHNLSGVIVWNDFAVANLLIPFYLMQRHLPTRPEDVLRTWMTPVAAPSLPGVKEMPAYLVKPECIPQYPSAMD